jgi:hypothetical protein
VHISHIASKAGRLIGMLMWWPMVGVAYSKHSDNSKLHLNLKPLCKLAAVKCEMLISHIASKAGRLIGMLMWWPMVVVAYSKHSDNSKLHLRTTHIAG